VEAEGKETGVLRVQIQGASSGAKSTRTFRCEPMLDLAKAKVAHRLKIAVTDVKEIKLKRKAMIQTPTEPDPSIALLGEDQRRVLREVTTDHTPAFITGKAGTGKSFLLRVLVHELRRKYRSHKVFVTASTGVAASQLGGLTIHAFAGVGLGKGPVAALLQRLDQPGNRKARKRWTTAEVLVVDEVSMLDGNYLDKINEVAQVVRKDNRPFGGIQVILCGDFLQLPPVKEGFPAPDGSIFAFEAKCWGSLVARRYLLTHSYRQQDDEFLALLNDVRHARLPPGSVSDRLLRECLDRQLDVSDRITPSELFANNLSVDEVNDEALERLANTTKEKVRTYRAVDDGEQLEALRDCNAPQELRLVTGAQVVLLKNLDVQRGLVNGAKGIVTGFYEDADQGFIPRVRFIIRNRQRTEETLVWPDKWQVQDGEECIAVREQIPLRLAWALTIHRCQGMTLSKVSIELADCFAPGMAYVALSRATCLANVHLKSYDPWRIQVHPKVARFYATYFPASEDAIALNSAPTWPPVAPRPPPRSWGQYQQPAPQHNASAPPMTVQQISPRFDLRTGYGWRPLSPRPSAPPNPPPPTDNLHLDFWTSSRPTTIPTASPSAAQVSPGSNPSMLVPTYADPWAEEDIDFIDDSPPLALTPE